MVTSEGTHTEPSTTGHEGLTSRVSGPTGQCVTDGGRDVRRTGAARSAMTSQAARERSIGSGPSQERNDADSPGVRDL